MRYSKKELEGLPIPKEIVVRDLAEYINLFSNNEFENYIFRGEPTNYHDTISSALRNKEYPFIQMKNEFRREIFHRLTPDERSNFLAFAQHHGIPTNLIDFTRSPLVALFFSCQPFHSSNRSFEQERGFVYLLKDELIDITDLLSRNEDKNFLDLFIRNENNIILDLYRGFADFYKRHPEKFYYYFKQLADDWQYYFVDRQPRIPKNSKFPLYNNGEYLRGLPYEYVKDSKELIAEIKRQYGSIELVALEYTLKLQSFLKQTLAFEATVWWLNCIPNFLYTPILSFERGRNQQGLFIYQAYLSFDERTYKTRILSQQRVWPDVIIVIENKEKVLHELDFMGINEKLIYGDYDSIARYIKKKYD
ncbi:FRG domain-containing protein [Desulfitobacterium sp. LBE]|uniref:FRG domain-containing protein n=1 Tax=Desulfitobacterium sp. LBE TaxID=884086 RepID=UPI0011996F7B|nr:FRG domain-containing protein [Desulfitobacterium sp. LBE]TWH59619.1 FRG domain-containing protein [Desulfitobacterium sp. LBE]